MAKWFETHFGFQETDEACVKSNITVRGGKLVSKANGAEYAVGEFATPSLGELRCECEIALKDSRAVANAKLKGQTGVKNVLGDVAEHHRRPENRRALFQVASQFNCLEFTRPEVTPEQGITGYVWDKTQGPCCSIACGAGTVFRNYFAPVSGASGDTREGQTASCQIENLRDLAAELGNDRGKYLKVTGGYTLANDEGLASLNKKLAGLDQRAMDSLRAKLRVGVQRDVQVTSYKWGKEMVNDSSQLVTQVFGSACSVSYSRNSQSLWEPIAKLILEASYEATLWAAVLSALRSPQHAGSRSVFLTALGGGVFGNDMAWIQGAIQRAIDTVCKKNGLALQIYLVSYCQPIERAFLNLVHANGLEECVLDECTTVEEPPEQPTRQEPPEEREPQTCLGRARKCFYR